jgi:hypothetical protein
MNKRDFIKLITDNATIFHCLSLSNATLRAGYDKFCVEIIWKNTTYRTPIIYGRGKSDSFNAKELLKKYNNYVNLGIHKG